MMVLLISPMPSVRAASGWDADDSKLPSAWKSFAPILIPVVLILLGTFTTALVPKAERVGLMFDLIDGLGSPVVAVGIGLVFAAFFLTDGMSRKDVVNTMDDSVKQAGIILLVTAAAARWAWCCATAARHACGKPHCHHAFACRHPAAWPSPPLCASCKAPALWPW